MKDKLKFVLPILVLAILGGVYKFALAKPEAHAKPKVDGQVYVLPKEFLLNLDGDRYAKLSVGLVLAHDQSLVAEHAADAPPPPEGFGPLPQEAVIRDIVTDSVTSADAGALVGRRGRDELKRKLLGRIRKHTDVHVEDVLFTDIAVQ